MALAFQLILRLVGGLGSPALWHGRQYQSHAGVSASSAPRSAGWRGNSISMVPSTEVSATSPACSSSPVLYPEIAQKMHRRPRQIRKSLSRGRLLGPQRRLGTQAGWALGADSLPSPRTLLRLLRPALHDSCVGVGPSTLNKELQRLNFPPAYRDPQIFTVLHSWLDDRHWSHCPRLDQGGVGGPLTLPTEPSDPDSAAAGPPGLWVSGPLPGGHSSARR